MPIQRKRPGSGPITRLFEVSASAGCAAKLPARSATTSAQVVPWRAGQRGFLLGGEIAVEGEPVVSASVRQDLDAVTARF